jgi:hypothetical protein
VRKLLARKRVLGTNGRRIRRICRGRTPSPSVENVHLQERVHHRWIDDLEKERERERERDTILLNKIETHRHIFFQKTSVRLSHLTEHAQENKDKDKREKSSSHLLLLSYSIVVSIDIGDKEIWI